MIRLMRRAATGIVVSAIAVAATAGVSQGATPKPAWTLSATPTATNFPPGQTSQYVLAATNVGAASPSGTPVVMRATLPSGFTATKVRGFDFDPGAVVNEPSCTIAALEVTCETPEPIGPGYLLQMQVTFTVAPGTPEEDLQALVSVEGGGSQPVSKSVPAHVQADPLGFGFVSGLEAPLTAPDGSPATLAGAHPYQQTIDFGFPLKITHSENGVALAANSGHPHEVVVQLPRGLIANPAATPVLCTEAELTAEKCPDASQVGVLNVRTIVGEPDVPASFPSNVYNMVPPPGHAAELGFNVAAGIFVHILGGVRTDSDYGVEATVSDILSLGSNPIFNLHTQLWGDPSSPVHDHIRGECDAAPRPGCPVADDDAAFLTMPSDCSGEPLLTQVFADSWENRGVFERAAYESADLQGNPVSVSGCNELQFEPTISVAPTTNLTDSPTGLDVDLHQPTNEQPEGTAPAILRDAHVTLPAGMSVNPSQADGLDACTIQQIGLSTAIGATPVHFSKDPATCPPASKLGTIDVSSPLLAEYEDGGTKLATDPETGAAIPRPLHGSVYLAKPFANPFGSLLAIYLAVEDERSGIVAKLAGRVEPDPVTGQLTTTFAENPELPLSDIHLHLFPGARGSLINPPTCGANTTTTDLVPWGSPETPDANPSSDFQTTVSPQGGGACPTSADALPDAPSFTAGTVAPVAGAYSPFVLKLSREDGSQRLTGLDTTLPPGLTGKLAGVAECSDAAIAQAASRSKPEEGILERSNPSCPASSEVGIVNVGAGAGPTPFYTQGHAYLAGPYKGAPISLAIITPAIAGPFDLGTVVVRTALYVDPFTAQIHAVSDPFPQILDGIPLDIRSVALQMNRPDFTLNPTSCNPMAITGSATSALGSLAPFSAPFQVGGCSSLKFKPSLTLKLKGGTKRSDFPSLTAKVTYPSQGAYANIASAQVNLPHSEFLEQGHIRTECTRPQLASHTCPPGAIYGYARAVTPLLDQPLEGPVYLGVGFGHKLPDLVADLNGQIEVLLHGKTDTGKNDGLRNTFQVVPDAPVKSFTLTLFGGKRGLIVNSENLCRPKAKTQAFAHFTAQNGKVLDLKPRVQNQCGGKSSKKHRGRKRRR